ncbi:hypothetical protein [Nostoc sp. DSM 114160]
MTNDSAANKLKPSYEKLANLTRAIALSPLTKCDRFLLGIGHWALGTREQG